MPGARQSAAPSPSPPPPAQKNEREDSHQPPAVKDCGGPLGRRQTSFATFLKKKGNNPSEEHLQARQFA